MSMRGLGATLSTVVLSLGMLSGVAIASEDDPDIVDVPIVSTEDGVQVESGQLEAEVIYSDDPADALPLSRAASIVKVIKCDLTIDWPHPSTHVNGTINVVAKASCGNNYVSKIRVQTSLNRTGKAFKTWGTDASKSFTPNFNGNAAGPCSAAPGNFQGWGRMTITVPPGYKLTTASASSKYGSERYIDKCGKTGRSVADEEPATAMSLTFERQE